MSTITDCEARGVTQRSTAPFSDAYGWTDIKPTCDFFLDYEEEADEAESSSGRKKKPWRYRWPDDVRDEVLARLLN
ncbi:MAG: hypothetical protein IPG81_04550 [Sandaracinaceae bacterium]|nr:hypothetical protein [Sandaracinaceae bacterium]